MQQLTDADVVSLPYHGIVEAPVANARGWVTHERAHVQAIWWAPLVLIGAYGIGCIFALPASLFIAVAGAIWGWRLGLAYAITGGMLGASLSYFTGRYLGEGLLDRFGKAGAAVKRQVARAGFKTMFIVRVVPGPSAAIAASIITRCSSSRARGSSASTRRAASSTCCARRGT